jgi:hypothetical protein
LDRIFGYVHLVSVLVHLFTFGRCVDGLGTALGWAVVGILLARGGGGGIRWSGCSVDWRRRG